MKRGVLAIAGALLLMISSGCGICDNLFCFHKPYGGCNGGGCDAGGCADGGCANGGCADGSCANGGYGADGHGLLHHGPVPRGVGGEYVGPQGPPTGAVAYPYYANRGPRDFLQPNPPSIGP